VDAQAVGWFALLLLSMTLGWGRPHDVSLLLQELHRFTFAVVRKWLPASMRSRNAGSDDCLDLQIQTDLGARDLRMRADSADTVQAILAKLRDTVKVRVHLQLNHKVAPCTVGTYAP
jgi:hypothetical protein